MKTKDNKAAFYSPTSEVEVKPMEQTLQIRLAKKISNKSLRVKTFAEQRSQSVQKLSPAKLLADDKNSNKQVNKSVREDIDRTFLRYDKNMLQKKEEPIENIKKSTH